MYDGLNCALWTGPVSHASAPRAGSHATRREVNREGTPTPKEKSAMNPTKVLPGPTHLETESGLLENA